MEGSSSRAKAWTRLAFLFLPLAATALLAAQANNTEQTAEARRIFLEIERAARLPAGPQSTLLPHLYRDVCSRWDHSGFFAPLAWTGFSTSPEGGESVEDLASRLVQKGGWPWLAAAGRRRCHEMLSGHRDEVALLAVRGRSRCVSRYRTRCRSIRAAGP